MKRTESDRLVEAAIRKIPRRLRDAPENLKIVIEDSASQTVRFLNCNCLANNL